MFYQIKSIFWSYSEAKGKIAGLKKQKKREKGIPLLSGFVLCPDLPLRSGQSRYIVGSEYEIISD